MQTYRSCVFLGSKGTMAGRILGLLWEMVMNPEAPPELSRSSGLVEAISHYGETYAWDYMQRCVRRVAANDNAPTALHMLRRMCEALQEGMLRQQVRGSTVRQVLHQFSSLGVMHITAMLSFAGLHAAEVSWAAGGVSDFSV